MSLSYDQMGDLTEEIAAQFPDVFFYRLSGGIQIEPEPREDPTFPPGEMYIMGEYCHDYLGRYIVLYHGSFAVMLKGQGQDAWREEIFGTLAHEFTHHMEGLAMLHNLDDKDAEFLQYALEQKSTQTEN